MFQRTKSLGKKIDGFMDSLKDYIDNNNELIGTMKEYLDRNTYTCRNDLLTCERSITYASGGIDRIELKINGLEEDYFTGQYINRDRAKTLYVIDGGSIEERYFIGDGRKEILEKGGYYYLFLIDIIK